MKTLTDGFFENLSNLQLLLKSWVRPFLTLFDLKLSPDLTLGRPFDLMTSIFDVFWVFLCIENADSEASRDVRARYAIKNGVEITTWQNTNKSSTCQLSFGWSLTISKLSECLQFGVYGMVFWGAESISDIIFDR